MTQEEKQLLLKDLCARLPYQPICKFTDTEDVVYTATAALGYSLYDFIAGKTLIEPYLRPMSSMTEEECNKFFRIVEDMSRCGERGYSYVLSIKQQDWLNKYHFDYHGLIPKGLALEAPEGMYKTE